MIGASQLIPLGFVITGKYEIAAIISLAIIVFFLWFIGLIHIIWYLAGKSVIQLYEHYSGPLFIDTISHNKKVYRLKIPIYPEVEFNQDGTINLSYEPLDLYAHGSHILDAIDDFNLEFSHSFHILSGTPDSKLSKRLVDVKKLMIAMVEADSRIKK